MATVVLTGFMGTGKSKVGENLARRLSCPFVDTDALVEQSEGRPIEAIFALEGEISFRAAERRAIAQAVAIPKAVIATGGGAILDPRNLAALRASAPIVCLGARPEVIRSRTAATGNRPLLEGRDQSEKIERLLAERAATYAKADLCVDTSDRTVDDVAQVIIEYLQREMGAPDGCRE